MYLFMSQSSVGRGRDALCQRTSISSIPLCRLGDGGIMGKLAAWAEAGADDDMLARREKALFGFPAAAESRERSAAHAHNLLTFTVAHDQHYANAVAVTIACARIGHRRSRRRQTDTQSIHREMRENKKKSV
jgi:hypothetical protein